MPSLGFDELPWPTLSGETMKYFVPSSRQPGQKSAPANVGPSSERPLPPCRAGSGRRW
jgi:hypothetical protein